MKEALMAVFRCSAEQMRFFLPNGLPHSPLPDRTWIRCLPVIGNTRLVYLVVMDDAPKRVRIRVPVETLRVPTPLSSGEEAISTDLQ
jgi:hypothetical protein